LVANAMYNFDNTDTSGCSDSTGDCVRDENLGLSVDSNNEFFSYDCYESDSVILGQNEGMESSFHENHASGRAVFYLG